LATAAEQFPPGMAFPESTSLPSPERHTTKYI